MWVRRTCTEVSSAGNNAFSVLSAVASAVQPIFEGGALEGQLEFSKARYEELLQDYRGAVISAFSNVEDALAATHRTAKQQDYEDTTVAQARRSYEIAEARPGPASPAP
jgi:multidrug efflux system outer membrane protein